MTDSSILHEYGEHDDGSPGSTIALGDGTLTIALSYPDSSDEALEVEAAIAEWVTATLNQVLDEAPTDVRALVVRPKPDYSGELEFDWLAEALAEVGLSEVRTLHWGNDDGSCFVMVPGLSDLIATMPQLNSLSLQGTWFEDNEALPTQGLRHLALNALDLEEMEAIAELDLTTLECLELWLYDHENEGAEVIELADLEALWEVEMPRLHELVFHAAEFGDALVAALPDSPLFGQLERLGLVRCTNTGSFLGREAADVLLSGAYEHLDAVDVTGSFSDPRRDASELLQYLLEEAGGRIVAA